MAHHHVSTLHPMSCGHSHLHVLSPDNRHICSCWLQHSLRITKLACPFIYTRFGSGVLPGRAGSCCTPWDFPL